MWGMSLDEPLGFLLYRVMAALRPQVAAELKPLGVGLPEFVCMRILAKHPGLTGAELARGGGGAAPAAGGGAGGGGGGPGEFLFIADLGEASRAHRRRAGSRYQR